MRDYSSIEAASKGLLGQVVSILGMRDDYVVVGGWSPYLLNGAPIRHPGTRDVDLLFRDAGQTGVLDQVVKSICSVGFLRSAKHEFQLLKILRVRGIDFVFNVDLLHPSEPRAKQAEFVEHMALPIPLSDYRDDHYATMSIGVPGAEFLFDGYIDPLTVAFELPDGDSASATFPVMREVGTVLTKSGTCLYPKRPRDAFDIYLAVQQVRDLSKLLEDLRRLQQKHPEPFNALFTLKEILHDERKSLNFATRVGTILENSRQISRELTLADFAASTSPFLQPIQQILDDIPLPPRASREYDAVVRDS